MADQDVSITEVDLDHDSMWARESTLEKLLMLIEKMADLSEEQKKEIESGFRNMEKTGKVTRDNLKQTKAKDAGGGNIFSESTSGLAAFGGSVVDATDDLDDLGSGPLKKFGKGLVGMTKKMGAMGIVAGAIMNQIGAAIATIKETVDAMRQLNSVGITIEGDFLQFQENLQLSATTIAELSEITSTYARTVGNVGLKSLVQMTAAAEQSGFAFKDYGLRLAEATEFQAEMLEADRLAGIFKIRDQRQQSLMLAENIKTLSAYSKILNVSREDMLKQRIELKGRADVQRRFNSMDDKTREGANASFNQFSDIMAAMGPQASGLTDMITTLIADPAAVNSEAFKQLAGASPEVAQAMLDLRAKIEAGEEISQADIIGRLLGPLDAASKSGQLEMLSMNDAIGETVNLLGGPVLNSLRNWEQRIADVGAASPEEAIEILANKTNESVKKATEAQTELDRFAATVKNARVKVFDNLLGQEASSIMDSAITGLRSASEMVNTLGGVDYRGAMEGFIDRLGELGSSIGLFVSDTWFKITTKFEEFKDTIMDIINSIMLIPARIENYLRELVGMKPIPIIDSTVSPPSFPVGQRIADVRAATSNLAGNQSNLDQAKAAGADPRTIEMWERMVKAAEATLTQITHLRSENREKE